MSDTRKDVVIIGSGPAGLSAAVYAKRALLDVAVIEKEMFSGGQIVTTDRVDNLLGFYGTNGYDLSVKFREHADALEVPFMEGTVTDIANQDDYKEVHLEDGSVIETTAVIVATGATHRKLGVQGEAKFSGAGVSYCATCDGAFFRNKTVAVVGGGDVALEDALYLANVCEKVYLIHRRDELRGARSLQQKVFDTPNIELIWDSVVESIGGEGMVQMLQIRNRKTQVQSALPLQGVFIAVGITPDTGLVRGLVDCDEGGYILADETCVTNIPGIFAAGDLRTKPLRQIVTAAADGANAITSLENYIYTI